MDEEGWSDWMWEGAWELRWKRDGLGNGERVRERIDMFFQLYVDEKKEERQKAPPRRVEKQ